MSARLSSAVSIAGMRSGTAAAAILASKTIPGSAVRTAARSRRITYWLMGLPFRFRLQLHQLNETGLADSKFGLQAHSTLA
jgi:hypothetical protein